MPDFLKLIVVFFTGAAVACGILFLALLPGGPAKSAPIEQDTPSGAQIGQKPALPPEDPAKSPEKAPSPGQGDRSPSPVDGPEPPVTEKELSKLREENESLQKRIQEFEAAAAAAAEAGKRDAKAFRFGIQAKSPVFDAADWPVLSGHMAEMVKIMPELMADILDDNIPSGEVIKKIQDHNAPLAVFAISAAKEVEGTGPNGAFTHPAVISNLARSCLEAAGQPLSEAQETYIKAIGEAWVQEETRRKASFNDETIALARTVAEVEAKLRFLQTFKTVLTSGQKNVLFNPETEGRQGIDLLSPALVYTLIKPVIRDSAEKLAACVITELFQSAGIKGVDAAQYDWIARQWLAEAPTSTIPVDPKSVELRFPHVNLLQERARAQVAATERLIGTNSLSPDHVMRLRKLGMLVGIQVMANSAPAGGGGGSEEETE